VTQGTYEFDICLKFNGTAKVKAPSKRQALEALKNIRASLHEIVTYDKRVIDYSISVLASAEERI